MFLRSLSPVVSGKRLFSFEEWFCKIKIKSTPLFRRFCKTRQCFWILQSLSVRWMPNTMWFGVILDLQNQLEFLTSISTSPQYHPQHSAPPLGNTHKQCSIVVGHESTTADHVLNTNSASHCFHFVLHGFPRISSLFFLFVAMLSHSMVKPKGCGQTKGLRMMMMKEV